MHNKIVFLIPILLLYFGCKLDKVEDDIPYAKFEIANTGDIWIGCPVQFVNKSYGMKSYSWDFGDGTSSTEPNPVHTYSNSGTFKVALIASLDSSIADTFSFDLIVFFVERAKKGLLGSGSIYGCIQVSDGGFLIFGSLIINSIPLKYARKTDQNGATVWAFPLDTVYGYFTDAIETPEKDFILVGRNIFTSKNLIWKFNSIGEVVWKKSSNQTSDYLEEIERLNNGNYAILTNRQQPKDSYITIINKDGDILEEHLAINSYWANEFYVDPNGNLIYFGEDGSGGNFFLLVKDASGVKLLDKSIPVGNGGYSNFVNKIIKTADGGYAIIGAEDPYCCEANKIMLLKTDSNGNVLFKKRYGNDNYIFGYDVLETSDGGFLITGNDQKDPPSQNIDDGYLAKTDRNGTVIWEKWFTTEIGRALFMTEDCSYLMFAQPNNEYGGALTLRKLDLNGN